MCNNDANHLLPRLSACVPVEKHFLYGYNFVLIEFIIFNVIVLITLVKLSLRILIGSFIGLTNIEETVEVLFKYF